MISLAELCILWKISTIFYLFFYHQHTKVKMDDNVLGLVCVRECLSEIIRSTPV